MARAYRFGGRVSPDGVRVLAGLIGKEGAGLCQPYRSENKACGAGVILGNKLVQLLPESKKGK